MEFFDVLKLNEWLTISIALLALLLAVFEGWTSRRHNKLSVIPQISVSFNASPTGSDPQIIIGNTGAGLAKLVMLTGEVDNHLYNLLDLEDFKNLVNDRLPQMRNTQLVSWRTFKKGTFFQPGEETDLLCFDHANSNPQQFREFILLLRRIKVKTKYYSIYNEFFSETFTFR